MSRRSFTMMAVVVSSSSLRKASSTRVKGNGLASAFSLFGFRDVLKRRSPLELSYLGSSLGIGLGISPGSHQIVLKITHQYR